jgi:bifunctional DNA-binding transcriptional regulator/antitoxin component of YhaV-PrlF toxin-antitoxin module
MQTAIVSPEGQIVISAEWTSALDLKAGDRVSFDLKEAGLMVTPEPAAKTTPLRTPPRDAPLEEKIAFYNAPEFEQAVTARFNAARASVAKKNGA